ncbi:AMP-binding protein [Nocardiopsis coralliicola]
MPPAAPATFPQLLRSAAERHAGRTALVDGGVRLSYAGLHTAVVQTARAFAALGVRPGDRVGIWAPNSWQWVVSLLAATYQGAVLVPVNSRYTGHEAVDLLRRTGARALVVADGFLGRSQLAEARDAARPADSGAAGGGPPEEAPPIPGLPGLAAVVRIGEAPAAADSAAHPGVVEFEELDGLAARVDAAEIERRADAVRPDDDADILFTSGTTGRSKGARSAHRQTIGVARSWGRCGAVTAEDRYLLVNPFFHSFGYKAGIVVCLLHGAAMLPQAVFERDAVLRLAAQERATILAGAPPVFQAMLDAPLRAELDLSALRLGVTGASVVPVALVERVQSELGFAAVITAYGLTEAVVATMCRAGDPPALVAGSCGRAVDGVEVRTAGPGGTVLGPGEEGEVQVRGDIVMRGYLDDPAATAEAVDGEGWLHTGDVGRLDAAGYLSITDRIKDMYVVGGFNVYPAEVEQVLARMDGIAEAAVVGVPDPRLHEVGRAYIVPRGGAAPTEEEVIAFCRTRLANFKVPRSVEVVGALPRNASGKILKRALRPGAAPAAQG